MWVVFLALLTVILLMLLSDTGFFLAEGTWWDDRDATITDAFVAARSSATTTAAEVVNTLGSDPVITVVRWLAIAGLVVFKRWRHLMLFVAVVLFTETLVVVLANEIARPRPGGVEILAEWSGFSAPSLPVAAVSVTGVAVVYSFAVPGELRRRIFYGLTVLVGLYGLARVLLAVDRVTDAAAAVVVGVAIPLLAYRLVTPDAIFPVAYGGGKTAHLDVGGRRGEAIIAAMREQLGLDVESIGLFGLEGSGGSTPLKVKLSDGTTVFAKLYARNHLRSDRWYKLGRTILYGALEDEAPFRTVRRLAEHEDHVMRLMEDAGVPCPAPRGIVEITPGREYLIVTDFLEDVRELSDAEVDEATIDAAMWTVSKMWDGGLAHRDIKPANLLVGRGRVNVIDHAFGEIRPSPWRQAIDLANMMLALSIHFPPEVIYARAVEHFSPDELAEAFAATRGVTIPGELRSALAALDFDALEAFRRLAPEQSPIPIQRWTRRRVLVIGSLVVVAAAAAALIRLNLSIVGGLL